MKSTLLRFPQLLAAHEAALACRRFIRLSRVQRREGRPLWMRMPAVVMTVVMYFAPAVLLVDQAAHAAPIVDPRAPVPFRPTITHSSTGVAADSGAPSKATGGELSWISLKTPLAEGNTQGLPLTLAQAITELPPGAVTPAAIPVGQGANAPRVIVKLDERRPTQVPTFDQAKDTIRQYLQALALEKAIAQFTEALMKNAAIQQ